MSSEKFEAGMKVRREVVGAERVDAVMKDIDDITRPIHTLITEYCWGEIWTRPGLSWKTRSLMNLSMLAAMNRSHELKIHLVGALNNGVTKEEIVECFLQVAIYCGVPAGLEATNLAKQVFKERGIL